MIYTKGFTYHKRKYTLSTLHGKAKLQYLFDYYKLWFVIGLILIYLIGYQVYNHFTEKENVLYLAFANVTVGETLLTQLSDDYLSYRQLDFKKNQLYLYKDLYLSSDPVSEYTQYAYFSSVKILAAINSKQLDLIIMNEDTLNIFTQKQYLSNLNMLVPKLCSSKEEPTYAIPISDTSFFEKSAFSDTVYLGILANSPRKEEALRYLEYLFR